MKNVARIAYYTRKVAEYGRPGSRRNRYRHGRLTAYKRALNARLTEGRNRK